MSLLAFSTPDVEGPVWQTEGQVDNNFMSLTPQQVPTANTIYIYICNLQCISVCVLVCWAYSDHIGTHHETKTLRETGH